MEMDELWSFVGSKQHKQWVWLAIDRQTREVLGFAIGDRSQATAQKLWNSLPGVYRQCAVCYTDYWEAYGCILPKNRHRAVGRESGQNNRIERLNNTLRQRISCLVRKLSTGTKVLWSSVKALPDKGFSDSILAQKLRIAEAQTSQGIQPSESIFCPGTEVRKSLSFSEKLENHLGALRYFLRHYNQSLNI